MKNIQDQWLFFSLFFNNDHKDTMKALYSIQLQSHLVTSLDFPQRSMCKYRGPRSSSKLSSNYGHRCPSAFGNQCGVNGYISSISECPANSAFGMEQVRQSTDSIIITVSQDQGLQSLVWHPQSFPWWSWFCAVHLYWQKAGWQEGSPGTLMGWGPGMLQHVLVPKGPHSSSFWPFSEVMITGVI